MPVYIQITVLKGKQKLKTGKAISTRDQGNETGCSRRISVSCFQNYFGVIKTFVLLIRKQFIFLN